MEYDSGSSSEVPRAWAQASLHLDNNSRTLKSQRIMSNLLKIGSFNSLMFKSQSEGALFVIIIKIVIFRYSDRCDLQRDKNTDTRKQTDNEEERVLKRDT